MSKLDRRELLALIVCPEQAPPEMQAREEFFNSVCDLTASVRRRKSKLCKAVAVQ